MNSPRLLRVMVVDDNRDAADSLAEFLAISGYEVALAYNGLEALHLVLRLRPDVMLIDLAMPQMDGNQLAELVRRHDGCERTVLIAVTGLTGEQHQQTAKQAGFDHFLVKPVDLGHLKRLLSAYREKCLP